MRKIKAMKNILYSRMYTIQLNGFALIAIIAGFGYGIVSLIKDFVVLFLNV